MSIALVIDESARRDDGLASIRIEGPTVSGVEIDLPFKELHLAFGTPSQTALDFLTIGGACYVIDKVVPRKSANDRWTRELSVSIPVADPARWLKAARRLNKALSFLSGDIWNVAFHESKHELFVPPRRRRRAVDPLEPTAFDAVSLFSGGLDSLIGAIDFMETNPDSKLLLIGHYDSPGPKSQQKVLHQGICSAYPRRTKLVQVRVSQRPKAAAESSLRARSIVFLALGLFAASECGPDAPLITPENGLIALNVPLTPSRIGSCSTRTMHPFYLQQLREAVRLVGIKNAIENPLEKKSKAECVAECRNPRLLAQLAGKSVSCSHSTRRQYWRRKSASNCGYCIPCLFRRASLHAMQLDAGADYGIDVCADELNIESDETSAEDLRALVSGLRQFSSLAEIRRALCSVAHLEDIDEYSAMVDRGFEQIRNWLRSEASVNLCRAAGLTKVSHA